MILNVPSSFNSSVFTHISQRQLDECLAMLPRMDELAIVIHHLANGKAAGSSAIVPELIKVGGEASLAALLDLIQSAWSTGHVPQEWCDAQLVPIPKKGDLTKGDNWRGIALLDVAGKVCGRVVQDRLQVSFSGSWAPRITMRPSPWQGLYRRHLLCPAAHGEILRTSAEAIVCVCRLA